MAGGRRPSHGAATQGRWHPARSSVKWGMRGELCHHLAAVRGRCASVSPPGCGGEVLHHVVVARGWAADLRTAARSSHVGEAGDGGRQVIFFLFHFFNGSFRFFTNFLFLNVSHNFLFRNSFKNCSSKIFPPKHFLFFFPESLFTNFFHLNNLFSQSFILKL